MKVSLGMLSVAGLLSFGLLIFAGKSVNAEDSPQWRGKDRTGVSAEKGLLKSWPQGGPKLLWKATNLGEGHATPAIAKGRAYGMGLRGDAEVVWALDLSTGKELWNRRIAGGVQLDAGQGGYGSRSTPTVVSDRLYALGVSGHFVCLSLADGKVLWEHDLPTEYSAEVPKWGYCESPLIEGNMVVIAPGGSKGAIVAFDKVNGRQVWVSQLPDGARAHYSSAIAATVDGKRQIIHFLSNGVFGVSATEGKYLWRYNSPANGVANCSSPIFHDNHVFAASSYSTGGGLAKIQGNTATEVYFTKDMMNHHGGVILLGEYLYGYDDHSRTLNCMEFKTGKVVWAEKSVGKGSLTYADGHLYLRSERGPVALIEASPEKYIERGRFEQPDRSRANAWPYPVVANGRLYLRDQDIMLCYEIKE